MIEGIRILADDLSGALDTAICFAGYPGSRLVTRSAKGVAGFACSTAARDLPLVAAKEAFARCLPWLLEAVQPFHKLDSRLRGHAAREIAAIHDAAPERPIIVAPALPGQHRVVRSGRVWSRENAHEAWSQEPTALADELDFLGHRVEICPQSGAPEGISLWDAETDQDLDRIAAAATARPGAILCGSSGLAAAFARLLGIPPPSRRKDFARPMLQIVGTAHPRTLRQIAHLETVAPNLRRAIASEKSAFDEVAQILAGKGSLLITPQLAPALCTESQISAQIAAWLGRAARDLPRPGSLFVSGGETLDLLTDALSANGLFVTAQFADGIPVSRFSGGRWDRLEVISKSGGFGPADLISNLALERF